MKEIAITYKNCFFTNHDYYIGRIVTGEAFISDNADINATVNYDEFETIASNNSAKLVLNMLDLIKSKMSVININVDL